MSKNYRALKMSVPKEEIDEELYYIKDSDGYYITKTGKVWVDYGNNMFFNKKPNLNTANGYMYIYININHKPKHYRLHKLVALTFIPNPNKLLCIGHQDNNKQNNCVDNLYWTTTQDNTQKAVDDGLLVNKKGIENEYSQPIAVMDNNRIIAVYGSQREAERYIENLTVSYLAKMIKLNGNYKTRNKKYKYIPIDVQTYNTYGSEYKNKYLIENTKPKQPSLFKAYNLITGEEIICDNQKQFAIEHNLEQAMISNAIRNNKQYGHWEFTLISKIDYMQSSGYDKLIQDNTIVIKNIKTNETKTFNTKQQLKDYFKIKGHDFAKYLNGCLIFSEWKIINI